MYLKKLKTKMSNFFFKKIKVSDEYQDLRIGVIGAGVQGALLAESVDFYGAKVVAVHDLNPIKARKLALLYKAKLSTTDLNEFFNVKMDGLLICTVPTARIEPIKRACEKNIHLLIEKPASYNLSDGQQCLSLIENANIISSVGFQLRYEPRYQRLKQLIKGHSVHLVRTVCTVDYYLNFRMPDWYLKKDSSGGPIAEQAIHLLDITRFVLGNPKPIKAASIAIKNMAMDRTEFNAENSIQLMYELNNGTIGVHTNHCGHETSYFDLELIGPHIRLQANATDKTIHGIINGKKINEITPTASKPGLNKVNSWLKAIKTGDRNYIKSDYRDSLNTQSLVDASIKSQKTQKIEDVAQDL